MKKGLKRLLNPRHVAVVGGHFAAAVVRQLDKIGYAGEVWPVNPKREEIGGRRCYASVADLPSAPDAAFVAVPREATIRTVAQLAEIGTGGTVCYASGFAEVGGDGIEAEARLKEAMGEMALVGPNCYGVINYLDGLALWPDEHGGKRVEKGVAIVAQSGNISISFSMQQRSLPLAYLIATGNQAGATVPDYIEMLLDDDRVTASGVHLEGLDDVAAFSRVALKALRQRVPIVVLKTGASELGGQITMSHTSSLAGADKLYDALLERMGVVRVRSIPELLETLKFLSLVGPLPSEGIASISCSGGEAAILADRAAAHELPMPALLPEQHDRLFEVLGERVALSNPLDYHTYIWGDEETQYRCFSAMLLGTQAVTIKVLDFPRLDVCDPEQWVKTGRAFRRAVVDAGKKGVVLATMQENLPEGLGADLAAHGVAPMWGVEECLVAIRGAAWVYGKQEGVREVETLGGGARIGGGAEGEVKTLDEGESKGLLGEYGILSPKRLVVSVTDNGVEDAGETAVSLGFPVVVKVLSDKIVHKSDVGGVALGLESKEAVETAVSSMAHLGDRFLIEKMAPKPLVEMILGLTRDPQFGLALVIGAGGILVELFKDSQTLLLPISRAEVEAALGRLKIAPLLDGYRGQAKADKEALIEAVLNFGRFAEEHADSLVEVDINPLFVYPEGEGILAVDGVVRRRE
ncbi:MAG: acetate--CoA ligase family protein [Chloroflexota bacterium]